MLSRLLIFVYLFIFLFICLRIFFPSVSEADIDVFGFPPSHTMPDIDTDVSSGVVFAAALKGFAMFLD